MLSEKSRLTKEHVQTLHTGHTYTLPGAETVSSTAKAKNKPDRGESNPGFLGLLFVRHHFSQKKGDC